MDLKYEVYVVRDPSTDEVVYVGEGKRGRHLHVNSGVSNVYILNSGHFNGVTWGVDVTFCEDKESAKILETQLIEQFDPACNILGTRRYRYRYNLAHMCKNLKQYTNKSYIKIVRKSLIPHGLLACDINKDDQIILTRKNFIKGVSEALVKNDTIDATELEPDAVWRTMRYAITKNLKYLRHLIVGIESVPEAQYWLLDINWELLENSNWETVYEPFIQRV